MRRLEEPSFETVRKNEKATSPAISAVIITAVTVVLVLVAGTYAQQILERQRGRSEFETVQKSFLAFDDAIRDIAWSKGGSRSARFTIDYGQMELISDNAAKGGLPLTVTVTDYPNASYSTYTGQTIYTISTNYVTLGNEYKSYLLGNNRNVTTKNTESLGRLCVRQQSSWVSIKLDYRVRVQKTYTVNITQPNNQTVAVNYVDIYIIKMMINDRSVFMGDFDLIARSTNLTTKSYGDNDGNGYDVQSGKCNILVQLGTGNTDTVTIPLDGSKVVFNYVISEIEVST